MEKSAYLNNPSNPRLPERLRINNCFFLVLLFALYIAFPTKKSNTVEKISNEIKALLEK